ncbi:hypothetical protein [Paenibacillus spongiae]|uniref:Uncharacterized protein n=1 Tax=Paenibacillus spongiae TaxID=2909671 RepID=A0ABY5S4K2_9BACL|nr:hypothetical protein [Paenibacillus spongiae]UVI28604.1 hypothetical protein L1F29_24600 [Paenibacillus spongiae]
MGIRRLRSLSGRKKAVTAQRRDVIIQGLRITSRRTMPLYRRIVRDRNYAAQLVQAVQALSLERVETIIRMEVPGAMVSVGAGFDACLDFDNGDREFCVGIFRPGERIHTAQIRLVSRIMLPLLRKMANSRQFTAKVTDTIIRRQPAALLRLVRSAVNPARVIATPIDDFGFVCVVKLPSGARYNFVVTILL